MKKSLDICSQSTDEVEEYISTNYSLVGVSASETDLYYGARGSYVNFDGILLEWAESIGNYEITPKIEYDSVIFNIMTSKHANYRIGKKDILLPTNHAIAYRRPEKVGICADSKHITLTISNGILQNRLSVLLDGSHQRNVEFFPDVVPRSKIERFSNFISELEKSSILSLAGGMRDRTSSVADMLVDAFLLSFPSNCSEILSCPPPSVAPRHVKRAIDYIHSNPTAHHSPEVLAALSNVSVRSLQYGFKLVTQQTIWEYQYLLRLERARAEILSHPEIPLTKIAEEWGFSSLSSFGQSFKKIYGVTPSSLRQS